MKFNINHEVKVKLTPFGKSIYYGKLCGQTDLIDKDGWLKIQLWDLMRIYGEFLFNGCKLPFGTEIEILEQEADNVV